ncbi:MAG: SCO family protein [Pseudolabrys sp.]|nr:SCO family protein [Pseudolabrys sp.]
MTRTASHILLVVAAFLGGLVLFLGIFLYAGGRFGAGVSTASAIGGPFRLVDQDNRPITDADFKGKPFLVFFGYTHCPDICPTTLFEISEVLRAMGGDADRAAALFITVDPDRDTPPVLKDYLSNFDPHLRGATGSRDALAAVEKEFRVYAKKVPTGNGDYSMDHSAIVYLMDKDGRFVAPFNLKRSPEQAAAELKKYL